MHPRARVGWLVPAVILLVVPLRAADVKVDLSKEQVGQPPAAFEPMVGTWIVAQDGSDKVIMVDGRPWVASKDNPTKLLIESARKLYGTSNEELMDNAKQFAYYPVAVLKGVDSFSNGTISLKFKTVGGDADRCSGILFNVKPNGDWLSIRYNDTENNVALWEFHNGIRRPVKFSDREKKFMLDRNQWHELKMTVDAAELQGLARWRTRRWSTRSAANPVPDAMGSSQPGPVAREQRGSQTTGRRTYRPVVEDRFDQLLQRLRRERTVEADVQRPGAVGVSAGCGCWQRR